tara:strand:- start:3150 stop:3620 length:471 start_codon:yes stop_codon:yes gene_type:complete
MALMDSIMQELQGLGFNTGNMGYQDISSITPAEIQMKLAQSYGLENQDLNPGMFQSINQSLIDSMMSKQYSPFLESQSSALLSNLMSTTSGKDMKRAGGGFAGSGQINRYMSGVKDVYGKGMSTALSGVQEKQSKSSSNILDIINSWRRSAQEISG